MMTMYTGSNACRVNIASAVASTTTGFIVKLLPLLVWGPNDDPSRVLSGSLYF